MRLFLQMQYPSQLKLPAVAHNWKVHSFKAYLCFVEVSFLALKVYSFLHSCLTIDHELGLSAVLSQGFKKKKKTTAPFHLTCQETDLK